jgi:CheY-like chemotaxis protein
VYKILLADDDEFSRLVTVLRLERKGHQVNVAVDGVQAVTLASENKYDVILMDVSMPNMDGIEACANIRNIANSQKSIVPIIAFTAHSFPDLDQKCIEAGFDALITKPALTAEVLDTIETVIQGRRN